MNLGVQYYRAPFPNKKYWADDFARIKDSGLNAVQLWILWAWVESKPGVFCFDDYDQLVELADKNDLGLIMSTIAEIQPYWIHRKVPGSEMIDHMGRKVVSSNRLECHFGLSPGGCTDHPGVWDRMQAFLGEVVNRYRSAEPLRGWDAWNELRWNVQADGLVCFCGHTLAAFRKWLDEKYSGLDGLNTAWKRRYGCWEEVLPGKLPGRPYTEMMAFEHFITWRANQHGKARYELMKSLDTEHPITVHGQDPCALNSGGGENYAIDRGNDWFFADDLDGVGCSSFPKWGRMDDAEFGMRVEFVKSAARDKRVWLSEVQGGRAAVGFNIFQNVYAEEQQRWIWNGIACGADTILFWCWRDEVFGRESAGFGLAGYDGLADQRLEAMKVTGRLIEEQRELIDNYKPIESHVGVLFSPQSYYLHWAQDASAQVAMNSLRGYCRALTRRSIPYLVVEEEHMDVLDKLKVLFLPRTIVTDEHTEEKLSQWVKGGGTLVCESECGAFNPQGIYRYPSDRFVARLSGICEVGRRALKSETIGVSINGRQLSLAATQWLTPWQSGKGKVLAGGDEGSYIVEVPAGEGRLVLCGSYLGDAYLENQTGDLEDFLKSIVHGAGCIGDFEVISPKPATDSFVYVRTGQSGGKKVVFVFFPKGEDQVRLQFRPGFFTATEVKELISSTVCKLSKTQAGQQCVIYPSQWGISVLTED